jgi:hypothetical protein
MNIYVFICTRTKELSNVTKKLVNFYTDNNIIVHLLVNQGSIFRAYSNAFKKANPKDEDIVILCHDDIEFTIKGKDFTDLLKKELEDPKICFLGPAGTTYLGKDAVWWNWEHQKLGFHKGLVMHLNDLKQPYPTFYGPYGNVAVLDGLFLAAKAGNLRKISLDKPEIFEGEWDFYDIYYTTQALKAGMINRTAPINMIHHSSGQLVGRDSWHKNREAFVNNNELPIIYKEN